MSDTEEPKNECKICGKTDEPLFAEYCEDCVVDLEIRADETEESLEGFRRITASYSKEIMRLRKILDINQIFYAHPSIPEEDFAFHSEPPCPVWWRELIDLIVAVSLIVLVSLGCRQAASWLMSR